MKKIKITKRERKAAGRNFAWWETRASHEIESFEAAGAEYLGSVPKYHVSKIPGLPAEARKITHGVPFIRIG